MFFLDTVFCPFDFHPPDVGVRVCFRDRVVGFPDAVDLTTKRVVFLFSFCRVVPVEFEVLVSLEFINVDLLLQFVLDKGASAESESDSMKELAIQF